MMTNCDAIVFGSYQQEEKIRTIMTFMQTNKSHKAEITETGFRFNILLFQKHAPKENEVEMFTAILGDPKYYAENMGNHGYHGMVVKQKACGTKQIRQVFAEILKQYGFEEKLIKKVIKATVV